MGNPWLNPGFPIYFHCLPEFPYFWKWQYPMVPHFCNLQVSMFPYVGTLQWGRAVWGHTCPSSVGGDAHHHDGTWSVPPQSRKSHILSEFPYVQWHSEYAQLHWGRPRCHRESGELYRGVQLWYLCNSIDVSLFVFKLMPQMCDFA